MKTLILLALKALPALKFGKLFTTAGTMLLSMGVYAMAFGWPYAAGLLLLVLAHEMGHFIAMRQRGLEAGAPVFIPFLGAFIAMKDQPKDVETEAYVAVAGPLVGTVAAFAAYFWGVNTGSRLWIAVSYSGFILNLFNLIPLSPLDGGRITAVLSPRIWFAGVPLLLAAFAYSPSPMLIVIGVLTLPQLVAAWNYNPDAPEHASYYQTSAGVKIEYAAIYLLLTAGLAIMAYSVHLHYGSPQ